MLFAQFLDHRTSVSEDFWLVAKAASLYSCSDTQCLFLDVALLVEILKGGLFLHLMTIWANTLHL